MLHLSLLFTLIIGWFNFSVGSTGTPTTPAGDGVVHAVLFYSPSCPHCTYVIQEVLPPIFKKYGDQLNIIGVDITQFAGSMLFQAAIERFKMESGPVPTLIVGDQVLIGSADIPAKLPGLIEKYLAQGGVDWPDIPGLAESFSGVQTSEAQATTPPVLETTTSPATSTETPLIPSTPASTPTPSSLVLIGKPDNGNVWDRITRDPVGNTFSILVLVGMVLSVIGVAFLFRRSPGSLLPHPWAWAIPMICIIGIGISTYMAYVETTQIAVVCGPVGDCNAVQQSEYARILGIPLGDLGVVGYLLILIAWIIGRFVKEPFATYANLAMLGLAAVGTLFSIYLTFLEPFVIGATCAWCITQAILMTLLLWLTVLPGKLAYSGLREGCLPQADVIPETISGLNSRAENNNGDSHDEEETHTKV